jgi:hypothetical protein
MKDLTFVRIRAAVIVMSPLMCAEEQTILSAENMQQNLFD